MEKELATYRNEEKIINLMATRPVSRSEIKKLLSQGNNSVTRNMVRAFIDYIGREYPVYEYSNSEYKILTDSDFENINPSIDHRIEEGTKYTAEKDGKLYQFRSKNELAEFLKIPYGRLMKKYPVCNVFDGYKITTC